MFKQTILSCCLLLVSANSAAMTIADEQDSQQNNSKLSSESHESTLHGEFTSLSPERTLKTSVGNYQLGASTHVIDRRLDPNAPTKVTIRFRNNRVTEVTIYQ